MHMSTGWGTTENVFILRQIIEKAYECNVNLHVICRFQASLLTP